MASIKEKVIKRLFDTKRKKIFAILIIVAIVSVSLFIFFFREKTAVVESIIKIGGSTIVYNGHAYDCGSDSLELRIHTWATQNDLLKMCQMCVLELSYPIASDLKAQMLGDCEWWTSSTTGRSRYRYRAIPVDSSSCGDLRDYYQEIACYNNLVFAQLIDWSEDTAYCPNNPLAYIRQNNLASCQECSPGQKECTSTTSIQECSGGVWSAKDCPANTPKCIGGSCVVDPCQSVTCPATCNGNMLQSAGVCDNGVCTYPIAAILCPNGCTDGQCTALVCNNNSICETGETITNCVTDCTIIPPKPDMKWTAILIAFIIALGLSGSIWWMLRRRK